MVIIMEQKNLQPCSMYFLQLVCLAWFLEQLYSKQKKLPETDIRSTISRAFAAAGSSTKLLGPKTKAPT